MPFDSLPEVVEAPLTETQRVLLRAADLIEHKGLAKHVREDSRGRLCVHGALAMAGVGHDYVTEGLSISNFNEYSYNDGAAIDTLTAFLKAEYGYYHAPITGRGEAALWNNAPDRTQAEVVAALRGAAAACGK